MHTYRSREETGDFGTSAHDSCPGRRMNVRDNELSHERRAASSTPLQSLLLFLQLLHLDIFEIIHGDLA